MLLDVLEDCISNLLRREMADGREKPLKSILSVLNGVPGHSLTHTVCEQNKQIAVLQ